MADDWKGEHLIKGSVKTGESNREARRLVSKIYHMNRRAAGEQNPAQPKHETFIRAALIDMSKGARRARKK